MQDSYRKQCVISGLRSPARAPATPDRQVARRTARWSAILSAAIRAVTKSCMPTRNKPARLAPRARGEQNNGEVDARIHAGLLARGEKNGGGVVVVPRADPNVLAVCMRGVHACAT